MAGVGRTSVEHEIVRKNVDFRPILHIRSWGKGGEYRARVKMNLEQDPEIIGDTEEGG